MSLGRGNLAYQMNSGIHRQLASTPAWMDILIIAGLCGMLFVLLFFVLKMSTAWQRYENMINQME
jgi:hypothetical protein